MSPPGRPKGEYRRARPEGTRVGPRGWAAAGLAAGTLFGVVAFAPAAWLAQAVAAASGQRLLLADAQGTVWAGSARPVLSGGADSRDATTLPGRLHWRLALRGGAIELQARQPCCLVDTLRLQLRPNIGRLAVTLPPASDATGAIGRWPAAFLAGLGTPWNTLQLSGSVELSSPGLTLENVQGRWRLAGRAELGLHEIGSRLSRLAPLGSYRLVLDGGDGGTDAAQLRLSTVEGPLQLQAEGLWAASGLRLRGEARADPGSEAALDNLLNLIGRRSGALSVLSIG
jgi:general secretion pathway protein N